MPHFISYQLSVVSYQLPEALVKGKSLNWTLETSLLKTILHFGFDKNQKYYNEKCDIHHEQKADLW